MRWVSLKLTLSFSLSHNNSLIFNSPTQQSTGGSESEKDEDDEDGSREDGEDNSISSAQEFEMEYGTVALKPSLDTSQDSNAIWVMESSSIVRAGTLQWRSGKSARITYSSTLA